MTLALDTSACSQGARRITKALILAAGEGRRLRPLTLERPKPMLPVAGLPALEHTIRWLRHHGITQVAINLWHRPEAVTGYLGDGSALGVAVSYSIERALLGTAGGAKRMGGGLREPFAVVYGDVLTDLDLGALMGFHLSRPAGPHLSMCLYRVPNPTECGIVELDETARVTRFVEKPAKGEVFSNLANSGILVMDPEVLDGVPAGEPFDFGGDLFPALLDQGIPMYGWPLPATAYLIDFGLPDKYARVQHEWPTAAARKYLPVSK